MRDADLMSERERAFVAAHLDGADPDTMTQVAWDELLQRLLNECAKWTAHVAEAETLTAR